MWILDSRRVDYEHPHSPLRNPLELFVAHPSIHAASQPSIQPATHLTVITFTVITYQHGSQTVSLQSAAYLPT